MVPQFFSLLEENYPETLKSLFILKGVRQVTFLFPHLYPGGETSAFFPGFQGDRLVAWLRANHLECLTQSKCSLHGSFCGWPHRTRRQLQPQPLQDPPPTSCLIDLSLPKLPLAFLACCLLGPPVVLCVFILFSLLGFPLLEAWGQVGDPWVFGWLSFEWVKGRMDGCLMVGWLIG